jgi:anti-sigma factor RsiW
MTSCGNVRRMLSFFLEKETDPLETLEVRRHLDACPACQARARRLEAAMIRCDALASQPAAVDIAGSVMQRLGVLKRTALVANPALAAKWSGIGLILAAGLAALATPGTTFLGFLARPVSFLVGLATGGDQLDRLRAVAGRVLPFVPTALSGGLETELAGRGGIDAAVIIQVVGTALMFGLMLAIPVALLTAWLLHRESSRS